MVKLTTTSNFDLEKLAKQFGIKHFSVLSVDKLPKKLAKHKSAIVNLDDSTGPGTHWVALYNGSNQDHVIYCDPFGMPPDPRVLKYLKSNDDGEKVLANTTQLQDVNATSCGYWCIYILIQLNAGISPIEIFSNFDAVNQHKNELFLNKFFKKVR